MRLRAISARSARTIAALALASSACATALGGFIGAAPAAAQQACPNEAVRAQQHATYLPECRAFERVSPADKNGQELGPINSQHTDEISYAAAATGQAAFYTLGGAVPGSESGALYPPVLSRLGAAEEPWLAFPQAPSTQFSAYRTGAQRNGAPFGYLSPTLSCGVYATELAQPERDGASGEAADLPPDETAEEQIQNVYVKNFETASNTLVTRLRPEEPALSSGAYEIEGATADCEHVIFVNLERGYALPLRPASTQYAPQDSLYEWSEASEEPRVASILPDGAPAVHVIESGALSSYGSPPLHEISADGTRIFFNAEAEGPEVPQAERGATQVYMRIDGERTVDVSASKTATPDQGALFEGASADGSSVFFIANYGLTSRSSSGKQAPSRCNVSATEDRYGEGCDLYEYRVSDGVSGEGTLTDLSADQEAQTGDTKGADVRGVVAISEDGSTVYFSSSGQIVPGKGNSEAQNEQRYERSAEELRLDEANVYVSHAAEALQYVATIRRAEAGSGAPTEALDALVSVGGHGMQYLVARVSPEGEYLLLASDKSLAGYDNQDLSATETRRQPHESNTVSVKVEAAPETPSGGEHALAAGEQSADDTQSGVSILKEQKLAGEASFTTGELTGEVGQTIDYRITVTDGAEADVKLERFADSRCTNLAGGASELKAGESASWTCEHLLASGDEPSYSNAASVESVSETPVRDPELYEFQRSSGSLTCVSCEPEGRRPQEPSGDSPFGAAGPYLEVHTTDIPENLLADGKVLFDSYTPLLASAPRGSVNPYLWVPEGLEGCQQPGGCVSVLDTTVGTFGTYFVGASENGESVYISSAAQLAPEDQDGSRDLYDVRVGGGKLFLPAAEGCEADGLPCQQSEGLQSPGSAHPTESPGSANAGSEPSIAVASYVTSAVKLARHTTKGRRLTLVVLAPAAGKLRIAGAGIGTLERSLPDAARYTLTLSLTAKAVGALRRHRNLATTVHVRFTPTTGQPSSTSFTARFR